MEEIEWVHEGSRWCCKVDACTSFYAAKWLFHRHLDQTHGHQMQVGRFGRPSIRPNGPRLQDHSPWMLIFWATHIQGENKMKKRPLIEQNRKWNLNGMIFKPPSATNARGMTTFVGTFNLWHVVGHHWHFNMKGGIYPTKCMGMAQKRWQPCWGNLGKQSYLCKAFQSCMGHLKLDIGV